MIGNRVPTSVCRRLRDNLLAALEADAPIFPA